MGSINTNINVEKYVLTFALGMEGEKLENEQYPCEVYPSES